MKRKIYNLFIISVLFLGSCNDLDIPPVNIIGDPEVFGNEAGVEAYMSRIYLGLPLETFMYGRVQGFWTGDSFDGLGKNTGEYLNGTYIWDDGIQSGFGYWPYGDIRVINYFLETLPDYASNFPQEKVDKWMGEAYFVRAYIYFALVKRYGGVPIIDKVQNYPKQSIEELCVERNTEDEVYAFIESDLDNAIKLLGPTSAKGRANKYVAAGLKSRAMLYAGTIAKYGTVQLNGLVGIPKNKAVEYFKKSYDAAELFEGSNYALYRRNPDKVQNYVDVFLDEGSEENIFLKQFSRLFGVGHRHTMLNLPYQMQGPEGYGSAQNPTVEFVELWGSLHNLDAKGNPIRFDQPEDILPNFEPRLRAIVLFPSETWRGQKIDVQGGIFESYPDGPFHDSSSKDETWNGIRVMGVSGLAIHPVSTYTGFHMRKYMNYKFTDYAEISSWGEESDWIDMRYAEILLNKAEAAAELAISGQPQYLDDALAAINDIRDRAGAPMITNANDLLNIDVIRLERRKELAFENQTWWDIRRWRNAHTILDHLRFKTFAPYYVYDEKKYIWLKRDPKHDFERNFEIRMYYEPIPVWEIERNNKLKQNPLW